MFADLIWFDEPLAQYEPEPECSCIRRGDFEDTRGCPAHGETRAPAVKLAPFTDEACPF